MQISSNQQVKQQTDSQREFQLGQVVFKKIKLPNNIAIQLFRNSVLQKLHQQSFQFQKQYILNHEQQQQWNQILWHIEKSFHTKLFIHTAFQPQMISRIAHINFVNLKQLIFNECYITNIQNINFISAINLQRLNLGQNNITNSKALQKVDFPRLQDLIINKNNLQILDISRLLTKQTLYLSYQVQSITNQQKLKLNNEERQIIQHQPIPNDQWELMSDQQQLLICQRDYYRRQQQQNRGKDYVNIENNINMFSKVKAHKTSLFKQIPFQQTGCIKQKKVVQALLRKSVTIISQIYLMKI